VSAKQFARELRALPKSTKTIDLRINSDGGAVTEARAIYALLLDETATINVFVDGIAASAASFIAMVGDTITIDEGSFFMIHDARVFTAGTASDLRAMAADLDLMDQMMLDTYAARTGLPASEIRTMMSAETWMGGAEAVRLGFADELAAGKRKAKAIACVERAGAFKNMPAELRPGRANALRLLSELKGKLS